MTLAMYKKFMRMCRGRLDKMDKEMGTIFLHGSNRFKEYSLGGKDMGVVKMADIATDLDYAQQDELVAWIRRSAVDIKAIDLKLLEMKG